MRVSFRTLVSQAKLEATAQARGKPAPQPTEQQAHPAEAESRELALPEAQKRTPYELLEGIHDSLVTQIAEGEVIPFTFSTTQSGSEVKAYDPLKKKHIPWQVVQIKNDGPNTVQVALNYPHRGWHSVLINETYTIDNTKSKRKIDYLYFQTAAGASASGRGIGKY